jgi:molybdenum cofactor cytidylyltransferase
MDEVCGDQTEAIVVTLVDVPMVSPHTIRTVIDAWRRARAPVVRPAFGPRRGHPVVFDRAIFDELRRAPLHEGARSVVRAHASDVLDVPVDDPGCVADIDTPADYRALVDEAAKRKI